MSKEKVLPEMTQEQEKALFTLTDDDIDFSDIPELTKDFFKTASLIGVRPSCDTFSTLQNSCLAKLSSNPFKNHVVN